MRSKNKKFGSTVNTVSGTAITPNVRARLSRDISRFWRLAPPKYSRFKRLEHFRGKSDSFEL